MLERSHREKELLESLDWLVTARWGITFLIGLLLLGSSLAARGRAPSLPVLGLVALIAAYNSAFALYLRGLRRSQVLRQGERGLSNLAALQMVLDLLAISGILYLTGGVESPYGPALFLVTVIGALLLSTAQGFLLAGTAILLYVVLYFLDYRGWILHKGPLVLPGISLSNSGNHGLQSIFIVAGTLLTSVLVIIHLGRKLRSRESESREVLVLGEISRTLSRLSAGSLFGPGLEPVLRGVAEKAAQLTGANAAVVTLTDQNGRNWSIRGSHGLPISVLPNVNAELSLLRQTVEEEKVVVVDDVERRPLDDREIALAYLHREWGFRSFAVVPLVSQERKLGAIHTCYLHAHQFSNTEIEVVGAIASSTGVALRSAYLLEEQGKTGQELKVAQAELQEAVREKERANLELRALQELSMAMQSTLNLEEILRIVVRGCRESLGFGLVLLSLVSREEGVLRRAAGAGMPEKELERLKTENPPLHYAQNLMQERFRCSRSYFISGHESTGVVEDRYSYTDPSLPLDPTRGPDSWQPEDVLITPLRSKKGELIGILSVDAPTDGRIPSLQKIQSLEVFASAAGLAIENATIYEQAGRTIKDLGTVQEVGTAISSVLKSDLLLKKIVQIIQQKMEYLRAAILLREEGGNELVLRAYHGLLEPETRRRLKLGEGVVGWAASTGETVLVTDVRMDPRYIGNQTTMRSEIAIPLKRENQVIGVLEVEQEGAGSLDQRDVQILSSLATQIAIVIENARLYGETEQLALTDEMTGIHNYRHFLSRLSDEWKRANRYHRPLSLIMVDIDSFKHYNDTHGHLKGDIVLRELAQLLARVTRDVDFVARYGGEEFVIILPETTREEALKMAERIRLEVRGHHFLLAETQPGGRLTVSVGVATYPDATQDRDELVELVDRAMYRAKRGGRDAVCA